jgi:hypothetical protein
MIEVYYMVRLAQPAPGDGPALGVSWPLPRYPR